MKKYILVFVILFGVAFVGMPYIVGVVAENETEAVVINLNEKLDGHGYFEVISYKRTYRNTESTFKLHIPEFIEEFEYSCKGGHGVISYAYDCLVDSYGSLEDDVNEHEELISLSGKVVLFGALKQRFIVGDFNQSTEEGIVSFDGGEINLETTRDLNTLKLDGKLDSLNTTDEEQAVSVDSIHINGNFYDAGDSLDFGELELSFVNFKGSDLEKLTEVSVEKIQFSSSLKGKGDNVEYNFDMKFKELFAVGVDDSEDSSEEKKEHDFEHLNVNFQINRINRKALVKLNKLIKTVYASATEDKEFEDFAFGPMLTMLPTFESFLTEGFGFSVNVSALEEKDELLADFDLELNDKLSFIELSSVLYAPETILNKLNMSSEMILPDSFLERDTEFAQSVADSSFYQRVGNGYKNKFSINNGTVSLNGKKEKVEDFIAEILQQVE